MTPYILTTLDICTIEKLMSLITRKIITNISVESIIQARLCLKPNSIVRFYLVPYCPHL